MIRIALVEDEAEVRAQLQGYVQRHTRQYGTEFAVTERAAKNKQILSFTRFCRLLFDGQRSIISFVQIFLFEISQNHQM